MYRILNCRRPVSDVLLEQTHGLADQHVVHFSDISNIGFSVASQAFENSCVKPSTANLDNFPNVEFYYIPDCEL